MLDKEDIKIINREYTRARREDPIFRELERDRNRERNRKYYIRMKKENPEKYKKYLQDIARLAKERRILLKKGINKDRRRYKRLEL